MAKLTYEAMLARLKDSISNGVKLTRAAGKGPVNVLTEIKFGFLEVPVNGVFVELGNTYDINQVLNSMSLKVAVQDGAIEAWNGTENIARGQSYTFPQF